MLRSWLQLFAAVGFAMAPSAPAHESPLRLDINIPAFRLDAYIGDSLVRTIPIAVGLPAYKTPRGEFAITSIEWNPWWIPPKSPWAADEKVTPPGPGNPMGRVKLNFRELYFLHGTPLDASIGSAASHGCIRLHNADAIALAILVHRYGTPSLSEEDVARLVGDSATRRVVLDQPVPIVLRYAPVEIRHDSLFVYRDIYKLERGGVEGAVREKLVEYGVDSAAIDTARVRAITSGVPRRGRGVSIAQLTNGG